MHPVGVTGNGSTANIQSRSKMPTSVKFNTLDVFTNQRFGGNPLGVVHVPAGIEAGALTQEVKQLIAREFNLSETIFLHPSSTSSEAGSDAAQVFRTDIFLTEGEIPFAGHPTIGAGWFLLTKCPHLDSVVLRTKAGDIPVKRVGDSRVRLQVPTDFKIHTSHLSVTTAVKAIGTGFKATQPLVTTDYANGSTGNEPIVSIVKGMSFVLIQVTSEEALGRLHTGAYRARDEVPSRLLGEWEGFVGVYSYYLPSQNPEGGSLKIKTRMIEGTLEDPATGSAASALTGYLATLAGEGKWSYKITQGVELGRPSEILVNVEVSKEGGIDKIELEGRAVKIMEGSIDLDA